MRLYTSDMSVETWRQIILRGIRKGVAAAILDMMGERVLQSLRNQADRNKAAPAQLAHIGNRMWFLVGVKGQFKVLSVEVPSAT